MNWITGLRYFIAIIENQGFSSAADKLKISTANISKQFNWLEKQLGIKLLHRTTRKLELTDAGVRFLPQAKSILESLDDSILQLKKDKKEVTGEIRIASPLNFGHQFLYPLMQQFYEKYPGVSFDLRLVNGIFDLTDQGFDLGISAIERKDSRLYQHTLSCRKIGIYASPLYLKKYGKPKHPGELIHHQCFVNTCHQLDGKWKFKDNLEIKVNGYLKSDNNNILLNAAIEGKGIFYGITEPFAEKKLTLILADYATSLPIYLYIPMQSRQTHRIKLFMDLLIKSIPKRL